MGNNNFRFFIHNEEGGRKKEEGRGKKEEGGRKKEEGRRRKEKGRRLIFNSKHQKPSFWLRQRNTTLKKMLQKDSCSN
ncbi:MULTISPECIES: hypothetical protein [Okeania]|uniref:hypothetical protein n=1 Tax=Okeania TaxID=1458928 RepID=UPI0013BD35BA|nr:MULTISPECIES: hypothetical protein [Okeania]NES78684.1 hypothetical protein [Okeania sp. SIO1H4]NES89497.1 hypothetical protein [Okeania sp. SIO2B9]NET22187.1 hypothetical protein [Okeania sp. SIO1H5]NET95176.1 hypothetical protein [Okeania sp. SIO1H2]